MPSISNLRAPDKYLTNFSLKVAQDQRQFKAAASLPMVNVELQSGIYRTYDAENMRKVQVRPVASGTQTTAGQFDYGQGQYYAQLRGLHIDIDPMLRANATDIDVERDAVRHLTTQMLLEKENRFYNTFMNAGAWGQDYTGVAATPGTDEFIHFDDASADIVGTIQKAMLNQQIQSGGFRPNTLHVSRGIFDEMLRNPDILDRINRGQTSGPAIANEVSLAAIFGLDRVIVLEAVVTDETTDEPAILGANTMLLSYLEGNAGLQSVTAMVDFNWVGINRYLTAGSSVIRMDHPLLDGTIRLETKSADHMAIVAPVLGTLFTDVLSS